MSVSYPETIQLDWRGMSCPEPILKTARAARELQGRFGLFKILADDEAFPMDLKSWARSAKAEVLALQEVGGAYEATIAINRGVAASPEPAASASSAARMTTLTPAVTGPVAIRREILDLRGQQCPQPILQLARTTRAASGTLEIEALADDPAFPLDVKSWARSAGVELLSLTEEGGAWRALLRRAQGEQLASQPQPALVRPAAAQVSAPAAALQLDLTGLDAGQRAQRLGALEQMGMQGQEVLLRSQDGSINQELIRWCGQGGHELLQLQTAPALEAHVRMGAGGGAQAAALVHQPAAATQTDQRCTLLVLHNDFEALMAALMTATAAAAGGMEVQIFFSFWGVNLLRAEQPQAVAPQMRPNFLQRMFAWMMPKGPQRQQLGKLNFGGMGTGIMRGIMKKHRVMDLNQLMESAIQQDVRFMVCTTSMSIMGLDRRDIMPLPNVHFGGVASFVDAARGAGISLVF